MAKTSTATITPRMILEHSSGISAVSVPLSASDLLAGALDRAVEEQEPLWEPGTEHGYGAFTFGALMNGAFQHALGKSIAEYVAENLTGPTGHNFWFGAPDDKLSQVAPLGFEFPILTADHAEAIMSGRAINDGSFIPILSGAPFFFGDPRVIQANFPSLSGVSTASDLAHLFAAVTGVASATRILSPAALSELARERRNGMDRTLYHVSRFGSGVELPHVYSPMLGGDSFGHQGAGGSVIVVDPVRDVVVSYVCTQTQQTVGASDASLVLMGAINQWLAQR
jgi:CubicO group peptidase (beta-lactamase class C family)